MCSAFSPQLYIPFLSPRCILHVSPLNAPYLKFCSWLIFLGKIPCDFNCSNYHPAISGSFNIYEDVLDIFMFIYFIMFWDTSYHFICHEQFQHQWDFLLPEVLCSLSTLPPRGFSLKHSWFREWDYCTIFPFTKQYPFPVKWKRNYNRELNLCVSLQIP